LEIRSNLSKIVADNKEVVSFFQIFERFMDLFFHRRNSIKFNKDRVKHARNNHSHCKIHLANGFEAGNQFRREEESAEKAKAFHLSNLAQRPDSRWISKKAHKV
jgi:hypothetical protein